MRRRPKIDANSHELDAAAEALGAGVFKLDAMGEGWPDRLFVKAGVLQLVEYKRARGALTEDQVGFHTKMQAHGVVVPIARVVDDIVQLVTRMGRG